MGDDSTKQDLSEDILLIVSKLHLGSIIATISKQGQCLKCLSIYLGI